MIDIDDGRPSYVFPAYELRAGESVRVYTDETHAETGGFSFDSGTAIWNNSIPDRAELRNDRGVPVSVRGYEPNIGCE